LPHVQAAKLRALGVTSARRSSALPGIPAIGEAGVPGYEGSAWYGVLAPAGTPQGMINRWQMELRNVMHAPELRDKLNAQGLEPVASAPAEFAAVIALELVKWSKVVAASGVRIE
jgi:tripartite-type tricarboxylate transporter receptor subunit TctC